MAKRTKPTPGDFTASELKAMLAARQRTDELEAKRAALEKDLKRVEKELAKLTAGAALSIKGKKRAKKTIKKMGVKKTAKAAAPTRKKRVAKKAPAKAATPKLRPTVESVVVDLLKAHGEPMAFKDILAVIEQKKLVKTKSKNFANVLRRTLSTSEVVKRTGRGIYKV